MRYSEGSGSRVVRHLWSVALTSTLLLGGVDAANAQRPAGRMRTPRYDPATVQTIAGEVTVVDKTTGRTGLTGIHLDVKTASGVDYVHLGPEAYVEGKGVSVSVGDKVEIVGSKVTIAGTPVVLAREITSGGKSVALRDSAGFPLWAGQGARRRTP